MCKKTRVRAGALVQWLWEKTHVPKVVSSNPSTAYWMDIFSQLFDVKIVMCVRKEENKNKKEAGVGPFKK